MYPQPEPCATCVFLKLAGDSARRYTGLLCCCRALKRRQGCWLARVSKRALRTESKGTALLFCYRDVY